MSSVDKNDDLHGEKAAIEQSEVLVNTDLMNDAFDGENREHQMSTWAAIKSHPWACLWAFTMCFTIVSWIYFDVSPHFGFIPSSTVPFRRISRSTQLIPPIRSWSPSTCS